MNKYKTLVNNTFLISLGTFGSKVLVFLMTRFYTQYLEGTELSASSIITQTANLLFPIISIGITEGVFRFTMDNEREQKDVFSIGLFTITFGSLLFIIIGPLLNFVPGCENYIWLIIMFTMTSCYHWLCAQFIRAKGNTKLFAIQGMVNTVLVIAFNIVFLAVMHIGLLGYVLSVSLADILCTLFIFFKEKLWKEITILPSKSVFGKMMRYSIPLIPATIAWWITSVSDQYMVVAYINEEANALYSLSYKIPTLLTLVSTIFMQAWQFSAVSESHATKREQARFYSTVWRSFQAVMFLAVSGIVAFTKVGMKLLVAPSFYESWRYMPILSAAMLFSAFTSFMGSVYVVTKKSKLSLATAFIAAVVNIILNFILIPSPLGAQGAAISTFICYFVAFICRSISARKLIPFRLNKQRLTLNSVVVLVQIIFMVMEWPMWIPVQVIGVLFILILNYRPIMLIFHRLFNMLMGRLGRKRA